MAAVSYSIRKSTRARRLRIAVYCDGSVVITQPVGVPFSAVQGFIERKLSWIQGKITYFLSRKENRLTKYSHAEYIQHKDEALALVRERVSFFNQFYQFHFNNIVIKNQRTRWGSCSRKRNLNFNYKILFLPKEAQDYIVVHELCHLKEFDHSQRFWNLVANQVPDYKNKRSQINLM